MPRMELHHDALLHLAVFVRRLVLGVGLAEERQRGPIGAGRGLDDVRHEALVGHVVAIASGPCRCRDAAACRRRPVSTTSVIALPHQLAFHVAAEVEIAAMGDALQLAELARRQERKGVFDVGRAARIVAQLVLVVIAQPQPLAGQAQVQIPRDSGGRARTCTTRATTWDGRRTRFPSARTRASGR